MNYKFMLHINYVVWAYDCVVYYVYDIFSQRWPTLVVWWHIGIMSRTNSAVVNTLECVFCVTEQRCTVLWWPTTWTQWNCSIRSACHWIKPTITVGPLSCMSRCTASNVDVASNHFSVCLSTVTVQPTLLRVGHASIFADSVQSTHELLDPI